MGFFFSLVLSVVAFAGGDLQSEHARHAALAETSPARGHKPVPPPNLPEATPGPDVIVYGYLAYWDDDLYAVPWDELSHIALFCAAVDINGNLSSTSRWDDAELAVSLAEPYGVMVHLVVTNFNSSELGLLLGSSSARSTLIASLQEWETATGVHGINIDFEGVPSSAKADLVTFTSDLDDAVGDVVLATPSVDWNGAWDYEQLSLHADLFIMGYGYHYSGSSYAGPVDPLFGGGPWGKYALDWTVDDYITNGADPSRVILGLPLYGYEWATADDTVGASTLGGGSVVFWDDAQIEADTHGLRFDEYSRTPWYFDGNRQSWIQTPESVRERIEYAVDSEIGGVGFWALNYDDGDVDLWEAVAEATHFGNEVGDTGDAGDTGGFSSALRAEAGLPFLAYVGDTVILSGEGSEGPDGATLLYEWEQVGGPVVSLSDSTSIHPSFVVEAPGTATFELVVGANSVWSDPAKSYVVVLDPDQSVVKKAKCGCSVAPGASVWSVVLAACFWRRSRRSV